MKKLINISFIYFILSMICGVFYREFTKFLKFTDRTTLAFTHSHVLVLGAILFLILYLFSINTNLAEIKNFNLFLKIYNIALPFMIIMMIIRGVIQALNLEISHIVDASISGLAGVSHILIFLAFIFLFISLKKMNKLNL